MEKSEDAELRRRLLLLLAAAVRLAWLAEVLQISHLRLLGGFRKVQDGQFHPALAARAGGVAFFLAWLGLREPAAPRFFAAAACCCCLRAAGASSSESVKGSARTMSSSLSSVCIVCWGRSG